MNEKTLVITYHDPITFLARRKDREYHERIQKSMEQVKDQVGMDNLVKQVMNKPANLDEFEAGLDVLKEFIEKRELIQVETRTQAHAIQSHNIQGIPLPNPPIQNNKTQTVLPKKVPDINTSIKNTFSPEVSSRFLAVYKNYKKLDIGLRQGIFQISKILNIPHEDALGLMATESGFNRFARSEKGAQGITQTMPGTSNGLKSFLVNSKSTNVSNEDGYFAAFRKNKEFMSLYRQGGDMENIVIGMAYYSYLLVSNNHDRNLALRKYNGGTNPPNVKENLEYPGKVTWFSEQFRRYMEQKPEDISTLLVSK